MSRQFWYSSINIYESEYIIYWHVFMKVLLPIFLLIHIKSASWTKFLFYITTLRYFGSGLDSNHFCGFSILLGSRVCLYSVLGWLHHRRGCRIGTQQVRPSHLAMQQVDVARMLAQMRWCWAMGLSPSVNYRMYLYMLRMIVHSNTIISA